MKVTFFALLISLAFLLTPETGMCAKSDSRIVVRIETVSATRKGGGLVIHAVGMGRTPSLVRGQGQLLRRNQNYQPNKDGLLEYDLNFTPPRNYSGDKLKSVRATLRESSVPAGVKGVRIYAEFNEMNAMLPEPKEKKGKSKKEEFATSQQEGPAAKKEEPLLKKEQPAPEKKEPALKKEKPVPKKEEQVTKKEEAAPKKEEAKKKSRWRVLNPLNWNPFRRKSADPEQ